MTRTLHSRRGGHPELKMAAEFGRPELSWEGCAMTTFPELGCIEGYPGDGRACSLTSAGLAKRCGRNQFATTATPPQAAMRPTQAYVSSE